MSFVTETYYIYLQLFKMQGINVPELHGHNWHRYNITKTNAQGKSCKRWQKNSKLQRSRIPDIT